MATSAALGPGFDVESFINEYYDAWSGTDEDLILSYYADNVTLQIPGTLMQEKKRSAISSFGHSSLRSREIAIS